MNHNIIFSLCLTFGIGFSLLEIARTWIPFSTLVEVFWLIQVPAVCFLVLQCYRSGSYNNTRLALKWPFWLLLWHITPRAGHISPAACFFFSCHIVYTSLWVCHLPSKGGLLFWLAAPLLGVDLWVDLSSMTIWPLWLYPCRSRCLLSNTALSIIRLAGSLSFVTNGHYKRVSEHLCSNSAL